MPWCGSRQPRTICGMQAVVLGAGPAGCAAALHLARRGHDVTLVDRDDHPPRIGSPEDIFHTWARPAVGQFRQPHNFLGRGRAVLRAEFPEVYGALLALGAGEVRQDAFLGEAPPEPGDDDLATIACRRPLIDMVLRDAVAARSEVRFQPATVAGLRLTKGRGAPHVTGVRLASGGTLTTDLVIDACGRNSPASRWLAEQDVGGWTERTTDSRLLYYSRHYAFRGDPLPPASILGGPRGDLGYLAFAVFIGDNATFCLCIMAPAWEPAWRALREPAAFQQVAAQLPGMADWLNAAEPITAVLPMGQLRNCLREGLRNGVPLVTGIVPIGDARCHTNPTFAFGLSLSLWHATVLGPVIDTAADDADIVLGVEEAVGADAAARYEAVSAEDRDRIRLWSGDPIDPTDRSDTMPLFLRTVVYRAAAHDASLMRAVCRRVNLLDPVDALQSRPDLLDRAQELATDLPPNPQVPRERVLAALHGNTPST